MIAALLHGLIGCGASLPPPPEPSQAGVADTAPSESAPPSDTAPPADTAAPGVCQSADLSLAVTFELAEQPTVAAITAAIPEGSQPAVQVSWSDGEFIQRLELDTARVIQGGALRWLHPLPAGAAVTLTLALTEGESTRCQTVSLGVPQVDLGLLPALTSSWTLADYPVPVAVAVPVQIQQPGVEVPLETILVVDHRGRYLWSYPLGGNRAVLSPDGVYVLTKTDASEGAEVSLEQIRWDGVVEPVGIAVSDNHHDFDYDGEAVYALSTEPLPDREEACEIERVTGDVIQRVSASSQASLWAASEDYFPDYPECDQIGVGAVSYLNGLSFRDEILAVSSSPGSGPHALLLGWEDGADWRFLTLADDPAFSDAPIRYEGSCAELAPEAAPGLVVTAVDAPHGASCERSDWASGAGELSCFIHNRHNTYECDSVEWLRVTVDGDSLDAVCVASSFPHGTEAGDSVCGDWSHRGNIELIAGRLSDEAGLYGLEFSPGDTALTGVRMRSRPAPSIERSFMIYDPNTDTSMRGEVLMGCLDPALPCTVSGFFASALPGLGDSWSLEP